MRQSEECRCIVVRLLNEVKKSFTDDVCGVTVGGIYRIGYVEEVFGYEISH